MIYYPQITGLPAWNHDPRRDPKKNDGKDKKDPPKKDNEGARIPAFMPGQKAALASQLDQGFGGGDDKWKAYLAKVYGSSPAANFRPGIGGGMGNHNRGPGQVVDPNQPPPLYTDWGHQTGLVALRGRNF